MITPKNLIRHELIGLKISVFESSNKSNIGINGVVVDETKNTLTIKTNEGLKKLAKENSTFMFKLGDVKVKVDGKRIAAKPENRIKIKVKKW